MKQWLIILCCAVFVAASLLTTGLTRALIDLMAFACLLWIAIGIKSDPAKPSKIIGDK
ncbi:hypothetical protein [Shewanella sp. UCD-KL12]|uniref:hypothetical protein n=1 Tax=Shewanella sp. UCD-KL12 TaxID=1917163 RepID=UPI0015C2E312|nr:hypothetical protein [Shewanella sp. UCD-KL12]